MSRGRVLSTLLATLLCAASAFSYQNETVVNGGTITGTIRYSGPRAQTVRLEISKDREACGAHPLYDESLIVGKDGGLANVVVSLPDLNHGAPIKAIPVVFDQRGCAYAPHVAAFPAGSTVAIQNSDGILHSIHTESTANPVIDMAQPGFKKTIRVTIAQPEAIKVTCDAHNWMEGWWYATSNPYYAITDPHGHYAISNVPSGSYTLRIWQEKLGTQSRHLTVSPGATTIADFTFPAGKK
jgi:plastocyanin